MSLLLDSNILRFPGEIENVTMSTIHHYQGVSFQATNAVDGNANLDVNECNCCASTSTKSQLETLWLQITLKRMFLVQNIVVYGRNECKYLFYFDSAIFVRYMESIYRLFLKNRFLQFNKTRFS